MILTLITVGKMLEARAKGKTTDALRGLMKLCAQDRHRSSRAIPEREIPIEQRQEGRYFCCAPGREHPR